MMTVGGVEIGECLEGTEISLEDYSRFDRDEFGDLTIIQRDYSIAISYTVLIEKSRTQEVFVLLANKRAVPTYYIGLVSDSSNQYGLTVKGYLVRVSIVHTDLMKSTLRLDVESEAIS